MKELRQDIDYAPTRENNLGKRLLSATIFGAASGLVGFFVGRLGDSSTRTRAQWVFGALSSVFGFSMSMYATKGHDTRPYDLEDASPMLKKNWAEQPVEMPQNPHSPKAKVEQVEREGAVDAVIERSLTP